jgi:nucleoside-diphosphate kinase
VREAAERTLVLIRPHVLASGQEQEVMDCYSAVGGLVVVIVKRVQASRELIAEHYAEHWDKVWFQECLADMSSSPLLAICFKGVGAIAKVRALNGATWRANDIPGTIRQKFATSDYHNAVHGSADAAAAERELALWFTPEELQV